MPQSINGLWNWAKSSQEKKSKQPINILKSVQHPQPLGKYELNLLWDSYLTPVRWASSRKQMTTNTGTDVGREGPLFTLGRSVTEATTMEISVEVSPTAKYRTTYHMTQLHHPWVCTQRTPLYPEDTSCPGQLLSYWEKPRCLPTGKKIRQTWWCARWDFNSAIRKSEICRKMFCEVI